jgi:hypothetical protein
MNVSGDMLGLAGNLKAPTHKVLQLFLTAGWVSARQSSISKMSSGLRPRWAHSRDMRTEWCRSSCRAEDVGRSRGPALPLFTPSQGTGLFPLCPPFPEAGDPLTALLRSPDSGVPFSSSSWTAVARMGTLWGDVREGHSKA